MEQFISPSIDLSSPYPRFNSVGVGTNINDIGGLVRLGIWLFFQTKKLVLKIEAIGRKNIGELSSLFVFGSIMR